MCAEFGVVRCVDRDLGEYKGLAMMGRQQYVMITPTDRPVSLPKAG